MGYSRSEDILENILGSDNTLQEPKSRLETQLLKILGQNVELEESHSRIEELFETIALNKDFIDLYDPPSSRVEAILHNILGSEHELEEPKSRFEELLLRLAENFSDLVSITVELPDVEYIKGDSINYDGAIVTATFENGKTIIISPGLITWTPDNNTVLNDAGTQTVSASYTVKDITKTWTGTIIVQYPINKIEVTTPPTKLEYEDGDNIDFTGIEVTAYREDNSVWGIVPFEELEFPVTVASKE